MPLDPGTKLGPYEITALLGAGGMGEVYRAHDPRVGREVAIKVSAAQFSERFDREARAVAALNHPNICTLYDVGPNYLVMELVEGKSPEGPMPLEKALDYAQQLGAALEAAHEKGITHRDLKPANIKVTPQGVLKVLDFGLAKLPDTPAEPGATVTLGATQVGVILGTAAYMSPEQARGEPVDKRADIWAYGVVLYEMLTGQRTFEGKTLSDTLAAVLMKEPDLKDVPPRVRRLIKACLERDPKRRLRDIGEAWRLLEEEPPPSPARSRVGFAGWVAAAVITVVAVVAYWTPWRTPPPAEIVRFDIQPPEGTTFENIPPLLSPDGRKIAFVTASASGNQAWIRSLDTLESRLLPTGAGYLMAWSPDSRSVVFATPPPSAKLQRIEISGGPPQTLCELTQISTGGGRGNGGRGNGGPPSGAWNNEAIIFSVGSPILRRVSDAGGTCSSVTTLDAALGEARHTFPSFLPDGRHFLYVRQSLAGRAESGVYSGSMDVKPEQQDSRRLLAGESRALYAASPDGKPGYLLFLREGTVMAQPFDPRTLTLSGEARPVAEKVGSGGGRQGGGLFSVSATGVLAYRTGSSGGDGERLTWFDRQGKVVGAAGEPGSYTNPVLSPDESQVAFSRAEEQPASATTPANSDLYLYDFARGSSSKFTFGPGRNQVAVWSFDGKFIVFASRRDGASDLYRKASSGAGQEEVLLKSAGNKIPRDWSRDGRFLLYTEADPKTSRTDLWYLPLKSPDSAPGTAVSYLKMESNVSAARFSPDGRYVAYVSDATGRNEVYVQPFPANGGKWKISEGGGTTVRWRRDGKELFYQGQRTNVIAVAVTTNPVFQRGKPEAIFEYPRGGGNFQSTFDVSANGQKFLRAEPESLAVNSPSPITVVLNWMAGLKR